jgi:hypothetical protein
MRAALLSLLTGALLIASPAFAQDAPISDQARAHFTAGVNLMQDPDGARYEEAYREFAAAYQASPSWKILGNLGICAMKLERDGEAIDAFEKYLAGGAASLAADEKEQFQRDLATLKAGVVRITLDVSETGTTLLDQRLPSSGSPVRNNYTPDSKHLEIGIRSGHHQITAKHAGFQDQVWEFDAVSGTPQSHTFTLQPAGASEPGGAPGGATGSRVRPTPTSVYIGLAATGAFVIGGGVVGGLALGKKSDFDKSNNGTDEAKAKDLHDQVKTMNLVSDVLFGAAVVSAGVVTYLYLSRPEVDKPNSAWVRVRPGLGLQASTLNVEGAF